MNILQTSHSCKLFYHIFINDNKEEKENKYSINKEDKIRKIRIVIDYQVKSFKNLFKCCHCIKSINFKKFYRNNITDMSHMFLGCSSLKELNLNNFNKCTIFTFNRYYFYFYWCKYL